MDKKRETNYYMCYSEWLDTTGASDMAISVRSQGNKDQSGFSYHLYYRETCLPASSEHVQSAANWLRLACSGWPAGFMSTCFYLSMLKYTDLYVFNLWHSCRHGLSQYFETGCPNRGFIDFCVSKVWYKVHTTNIINPIYLQILLF